MELTSYRHPTSLQRKLTFPEETYNSLHASVHVMPLRIDVKSVISTTTTTDYSLFFKFTSHKFSRGHPLKFSIPLTKSNAGKLFFNSRVINAWNSLSADTVIANSRSTFKRKINAAKKILSSKLLYLRIHLTIIAYKWRSLNLCMQYYLIWKIICPNITVCIIHLLFILLLILLFFEHF